ncbi:MAG: PASTA domain-containing protein, partial [Thermoleophilaceae bacterium]
LEQAGFKVKVREADAGDPSQVGVVIGSDPSAGSSQPKGSTVTIIVGKTPPDTGGTPTTTTP